MNEFGTPRLDFATVTSTLDIAREVARHGAPHGTLITASHQTSGRGRRGASWLDRPAQSALMTFILRPGSGSQISAWRVPFIASLACVRALHSLGFAAAQVKWPNDLVIGGAKVGGILVESFDHTDSGPVYCLGIGINVTQSSFPDSADYVLPPTSLLIAAEQDRLANIPTTVETVACVCEHLDVEWQAHHECGDSLVNEWRKDMMVGHAQRGISLTTGEVVSGELRDVRATDGAALIETAVDELTAILPAAA